MAAKTFMLTYAYVPDMLERRGPYRDAHLEHLRQAKAKGLLILAGAYADPVDGALLLCQAELAVEIYVWLANDPYNHAGLIRSVTVREVNLAVQP
jgi:uncharacterized protein YciI